jgi:hypothetical protein
MDIEKRPFPHPKAHPARFGATAQLTHLALSGPSIRRKRHKSVMSIVRIVMNGGVKL